MDFKKYENPEEFVEENEKLILEKEWLNNLMVGNYKDAVKLGIDKNWLLARITNNGKTELIILLRRPWKLLLDSPTDNESDGLYKFAAEEVYKVDKDIDNEYKVIYSIDMDKISDSDLSKFNIPSRNFKDLKKNYQDLGYTCK